MEKKSITNDLYQEHSMLGKKILKMTPPSIQKFNLEDTGKLFPIAAASEMTEEYLINRRSFQNMSMS